MGKKIAESTQLKTKDVKGVFAALRTIACAEVKKTEKFVIPQLTTLKLKHKAARKASKKMMFGKEVKVAAKPASKVVKAFPAKALKDSIFVTRGGRIPWGWQGSGPATALLPTLYIVG